MASTVEDEDEVSGAIEALLEDSFEDDFAESEAFADDEFCGEDELDDIFDSFDDLPSAPHLDHTTVSAEDDTLPDGIPEPSRRHLSVLQESFGHSSFRPMQWKIIHAVLQGHDNCVVMATGYGKSLCYQFPAVYTGGVSVVVSPLISLMQDQVLALQASNIEACFLGSAQKSKSEVYSDMLASRYRVVYITPEFADACMDVLATLNKRVSITLFAIDEAHCVSQWGHDFRTSYRQLGALKRTFPNIPILAVTATATHVVRQDICASLGLRSPVVTITSFDRPNLYLEVRPKKKDVLADILPLMIKDEKGHYSTDGATIIYCPTKKSTDLVVEMLRSAGINCEKYHAGMSQDQRKRSHENFVCDKVDLIAATIAFGMGINKPDVRRIIHYGAPRDHESYYQEIGRAGRDGLPSVCTVIYAPEDFSVHRYFLMSIRKEEYQHHRKKMLEKMERYLGTTSCRRADILSHFTSRIPSSEPKNDCCDNCTRALSGVGNRQKSRVEAALDSEGKYDFTKDAIKLMNTAEGCGGMCAVGTLIFVLRGSNSQRVKPHWKKLQSFGAGKDRSESYWKALCKMLVFDGYLSETTTGGGGGGGFRGRGGWGQSTFSYDAIGITRQGMNARGTPNCKILLKPSTLMLDELRYIIKVPKHSVTTTSVLPSTNRVFNPSNYLSKQDVKKFRPSIPADKAGRDQAGSSSSRLKEGEAEELEDYIPPDPREEKLKMELYKSLLLLRNRLGEENGFMPYLVATNKVLLLVTQSRPTSLDSLRKIEGMVEAKVQKFGAAFIEHIRTFCKKNDLKCGEGEELDLTTDPSSSTSRGGFTSSRKVYESQPRIDSSITDGIKNNESSSSGWLSVTQPRVKLNASSKEDASVSGVGESSNSSSSDTVDSVSDVHMSTECRTGLTVSELESMKTSTKEKSVVKTENNASENVQMGSADRTQDKIGNEQTRVNSSGVVPKYSVPILNREKSGTVPDFMSDSDDDMLSLPTRKKEQNDSCSNTTKREMSLSEKIKSRLPTSNLPITTSVKDSTSPSVTTPVKPTSSLPTTSSVRTSPYFGGKAPKRRGIAFDDDSDTEEENIVAPKGRRVAFDDTEEENSVSESNDSQEKYERILQDNKNKLGSSGWIDAKKMKKKIRKNSLFKK